MARARLHTPSWRQGFARYRHRSAHPGLWDGLVGGWFPSLGPTGLTLRDISGLGNHGALTNIDPATDWVMGEKGWALDFTSGSSQRIACGNKNSLDLTDRMTLVAWVKPDAGGSGHNGVVGTPNYQSAYSLYLRNAPGQDVAAHFTTPGGARYYVVAGTVTDGQWHQLVSLFDGTTLSLFIDGVKTGTTNSAGTARQFDGVYIGYTGNVDPPGYFDGQIGPVSIYNRDLTLSERQQLYVDPMALVRRRSMIFPAGVTAVPGPYSVAAGLPYVTGSAAGDAYTSGSAKGDVFTSGSVAGTLT